MGGDNVVRLPRDWLGPREDLVPFGPSAYRDASEVVTELPRSADDFWGGADSQETVEAVSSPADPAQPARRRSLASLRRLSHPRPSLPLAARGLLSRAALAAGVGLLGILAAVGFVIGSGGGKHAVSGLRADTSLQSGTASSSFDARANDLRERAARHASHVRVRHGATVRHRAEIRRHRASAQHRHRRRTAPTTVQAVKYTSPGPVATSDAAVSSSSGVNTSAPAGETGAASGPTTTNSSPPTTASSASTGNSSSSSNQPAIGANGSLGPGSSPDG